MPVTRLAALGCALALLLSALAPPPTPRDAAAAAARVAGVGAVVAGEHGTDPCAGHTPLPEGPLAVWKARCPCGCGGAAAPGTVHGRIIALSAVRPLLAAAPALLALPVRAESAAPAAPQRGVDHVPRA